MRFSHRAQFHQSEFHDCNLGDKENSVGRAMCITSTLFYTRFAGVLFRTFKQDVFKSRCVQIKQSGFYRNDMYW